MVGLVGGLINVILTGIIMWVLVVLASHDGVRRKRDGEAYRVILRQQDCQDLYSFIPVLRRN